MRYLVRFLAIVLVASTGLATTAVLLFPQAESLLTASEGKVAELNLDPLSERSLVFDRFGNVMAALHAEVNRSPVALADVPQQVVKSILAVEDEHFYDHSGIDLRSTIRALFENLDAGQIEQGGSTITMQVVKNSFLTPERDLDRKVKEAVLARRLEKQMTKDEILERYLNTAYFGNGAYGVQAASEIYFGVPVGQLDWSQGALLAALIRNPRDYDPFRNPDLARERRHLALGRLVETGTLSQADADGYNLQPLPATPFQVTPPPKDYFVEEVKQQLLDDPRLGATHQERYNAVFQGGLRIYTTFDPVMQQQALDARQGVLPGGDGSFSVFGRLPGTRVNKTWTGTASVVSVEPSTGAIRTMVGGPGFEKFQYNIAAPPKDRPGRQAGSSFKTFVLLAALENGYVPNDTVDGHGPCSFPNPTGTPNPYVVENFGNSSGSSGTITKQTLGSVNCAYVRLGQIVGLDKVIEVARRVGISTPLAPELSLPIGSFEVKPLEMAAAYAAIANDGVYNAPYYIDRVESRDGKVVFQHQAEPQQAISTQTARLAAQVLQQNVASGTGTRARVPGQATAGKTGTAQDSADAWFVGFTPQLATAVWMGVPEGRVPMRNVGGITVTGGSYPARIWGAFMTAALEGQPGAEFAAPDPTRPGKYLRLPGREKPKAGHSTKSRSGTTTTKAPSSGRSQSGGTNSNSNSNSNPSEG